MSSQNGFSGERSMNGLISITGESIQASTVNCDVLETNTLIVNTNVDFDPSTTGDIYSTNATFDNLTANNLTVNSTVSFDPSTSGDIYATNGNFDNLTANTFSFPFTPTELNVGTNLFSNDEPADFTVGFNQVDNYQYNITTGNTVDLMTITIPSGIPSKLISWSMPSSWRTDVTKNLTGNITLNYGYAQNGILQTRWQVYKNGVLDSELAVSNDANTNTQNLVLAFTQTAGTPNINATIFAFMGNLSGSFTTDYDDVVSNTYVVKLTWVSTTTESATGGGTNTFSQSLSLNTTRNITFITSPQFDITTANNPIGITLDKFVKGEGTQVGTTTVDNLIVNEIRSNINLDEGFNGVSNPITFNPSDPINMTGSAVISNTIKSPSFYSSTNDEYDYSIAYTSTLETASVNNGNGTITRNATVSRNTRVLLQTVNIPEYYQNTSFSFDYPLTLISSFSSTTTLNQNPTIVNTHTFNWTSSTFTIYKNDILWKTTPLTIPTGGISTVIVQTSPQQPVNTVYTYSYTVYIGNAFGSWTPDFNYTTTDDVYTLYLVPNMTLTNSQSLSTMSGTFTLGINNSQQTRTYTSSGPNWVINLANYATGYSTRTFTENLFAMYAPTGLTIVDDLKANTIKTTTSQTTTATITTANITTSNINTANSTNINNSNVSTSKFFAINYTSLPVFSDPDYIGYYKLATVSAGFVISNTVIRNATTMTLSAGSWLVSLSGELNVNNNWDQDYFRIGVNNVSATFAISSNTMFRLKNGSQNFWYSQTYVFGLNNSDTLYYVVTGGNNQEINNGLMRVFRIA